MTIKIRLNGCDGWSGDESADECEMKLYVVF